MRLCGECVSRAEAVLLRDVGVPVEPVEELIRRGLRGEKCGSCTVAAEEYARCVLERCMEKCRGSYCSGGLCSRNYWVCLADCASRNGLPHVASGGAMMYAGLI